MTIKELIERLQKFDTTWEIRVLDQYWNITDDFEIFLNNDTYEEWGINYKSKDIVLWVFINN